jgi:hypothetical protein
MTARVTAVTQGHFALDVVTWVLVIALYAVVLYVLLGVALLPVWGLGAALGAPRLRKVGRGRWSLPWLAVEGARGSSST